MKWFLPNERMRLLALLLALVGVANVAPAELPKIDELRLVDLQGTEHTLAVANGTKSVVLIFIGTECPVSNGYVPEYNRLQAEFGPRGIELIGVYPDPDVSREAALKHVQEYKIAFPVTLDPQQVLATKLGARVTPEAVVMKADGQVVYRGRIDDRYLTTGKRRNKATRRDLAEAIRAVLEGKSPQVSETEAFGCPLPKPKT